MQLIARVEILAGVERADQPVQAVGFAGQTDFLAELVELVAEVAVRIAVQDVDGGEVGVLAVDGFPVAPRRDRTSASHRQARRSQLISATRPCPSIVLLGAAIGDRRGARTDRPDWRTSSGCQRVQAPQHAGRTGDQHGLRRRAAVLVALGVVGRRDEYRALRTACTAADRAPCRSCDRRPRLRCAGPARVTSRKPSRSRAATYRRPASVSANRAGDRGRAFHRAVVASR